MHAPALSTIDNPTEGMAIGEDPIGEVPMSVTLMPGEGEPA